MAFDAVHYLAALARGGLKPFLRQVLGEKTLADVVARHARRRPDAPALEVAGARYSYRELQQLTEAAAAWLGDLGASSGEVVAVLGRNSAAYVGLLLAAARSGVTLALVPPELSGEPLRHALEAARAGYVVCELELVEVVRGATALALAGFDALSRAPFPEAKRAPEPAPDRATHDLALVYTSGTTGLPKACRLPHSRVLAAACLFGAPLYDFRASDRLLCALPLHHGSPLMLGLGVCLVSGTPLVLARRFSVSDFFALARDSGATALLYVGDLGRLLLTKPVGADDREHSLRLAVGNGMAPEVWPEFQRRFGIAEVREFYAATESPVGIFNFSGRVGSVGNLPYAWMFGLKLARFDPETGELVRDAAGRVEECAVGEPGELLVRARRSGLGVYHGYVDGDATEQRLVRSAFREGDVMFRTGDVLRRDREGFYYFVERRGDSYRFRGENVAVAQVEQELCAFAGVRGALVTGVVVPGYDGHVGLAALVCEPGFDVTRLAELAARLPRAALPRFVRVLSELPRTASLKLKRRALGQQGFDPERVPGPLWVWLEGGYRPLTPEAHRDILTGRARL